jgi:hypothetical protein
MLQAGAHVMRAEQRFNHCHAHFQAAPMCHCCPSAGSTSMSSSVSRLPHLLPEAVVVCCAQLLQQQLDVLAVVPAGTSSSSSVHIMYLVRIQAGSADPYVHSAVAALSAADGGMATGNNLCLATP